MSNLLEKETRVEFTRPVVQFRCMKCGFCCEHLIKKTQYGKLSLFLMPEEAKWFPVEKVFPLYGAGTKGRSRPRPASVFAYQLDSMVCTWLDREARTCMMRNHRPLACQAYPVNHGQIDINCRFVAQFVEEENQTINVEPRTIKNEVVADNKVLQYIKESIMNKGTLWCWSLDVRTWRLVASRTH